MSETITELRSDLADTQRHRDALVTENTRLSREFKRIHTAEKTAAEAKEKATKLADENKTLKAELAATKIALETARTELGSVRNKAARLDAIVGALNG